tara:strand:+ start:18064 stop:18351 length:288 start_codon:yes stop_codon:yes gene_type:complete
MSDTETKTTSNPQKKFDNEEVGAFWKRKAQNGGQTYLAGHVEGLGKVVVFTNKSKTSDNHPDYRVYKSKPLNADTAKAAVSNADPSPSEVSEELM